MKLYPPDASSKFWTIGVKEDFIKNPITVNISCLVETFENLEHFTKLSKIEPEKTECSVPEPQDPDKLFKLHSMKIRKVMIIVLYLRLSKTFSFRREKP